MVRYLITTLGCKVNQYDSAALEAALAAEGLRPASGRRGESPTDAGAGKADLVVINTCCVTAAAMAKSRRAVARALRAAPGAAVIVTGCYAAFDPARLTAVLESLGVPAGRTVVAGPGDGLALGIRRLAGPLALARTRPPGALAGRSDAGSDPLGGMEQWMSASQPLTRATGSFGQDIRTRRQSVVKRNHAENPYLSRVRGARFSGLVASASQASEVALPNQVSEFASDAFVQSPWIAEATRPTLDTDPSLLPLLEHFPGHQRAFVKVQDGCDAFCAYCVVPFTRPVVRWRPVETVLEECRRLLRAGHRELVLCGVFLGAYGRSTARRRRWGPVTSLLPELVRRVGELDGLWRLRLSSLEPGDLTDELLAAFRDTPAAAWHFHLPLQSGSPRILKRMNRQYTAEQFRRAVDRIRAACPDAAVTTDILVGFPGESNDDFRLTLDMARHAGFSKIHAFPFSAIEGTAAWTYRREAPKPPVVRQRLAELSALEKELAAAYRAQFVGRTMEAVVEKTARAPTGGTPGLPGEAMTDRYLTVFFSDAGPQPGEVAAFRVKCVHPDGLQGRLEGGDERSKIARLRNDL